MPGERRGMTLAKYLEAVNELEVDEDSLSRPSIFLAGGITGCPDWQADMVAMLDPLDVLLINPRRSEWDIDDPYAAEAQIKWEHKMLRYADEILFWFPKETLCPITLYELGFWTGQRKKITIGCDPGYARIQDIDIQTKLINNKIRIVHSLNGLADMVRRSHE